MADSISIADVKTRTPDCSFVGDAELPVARYDGLPFAAVAFHSQHGVGNRNNASWRMVTLTRQLVPPEETFYGLGGEEQSSLVRICI